MQERVLILTKTGFESKKSYSRNIIQERVCENKEILNQRTNGLCARLGHCTHPAKDHVWESALFFFRGLIIGSTCSVTISSTLYPLNYDSKENTKRQQAQTRSAHKKCQFWRGKKRQDKSDATWHFTNFPRKENVSSDKPASDQEEDCQAHFQKVVSGRGLSVSYVETQAGNSEN